MDLIIGDQVIVKLDTYTARYGIIISGPHYPDEWNSDRFPAKWLVRLDGMVNARWIAVTDIIEKRSSLHDRG